MEPIPLDHIHRFGAPGIAQDHPIAQTVDAFLRSIDSLASSFPVITQTLEQTLNDANKAFREFVQTKAVVQEEATRNVKFSVPPAHEREFYATLQNTFKAEVAMSIVPQGLLIALVGQYDAFMAKLIQVLYKVKPDVLKGLEKEITVKELMRYSTIEEAIKDIIDDDIDATMRESHAKQVSKIAKRFNVNLPTDNVERWSQFIEVTERRNLFAHTNGAVSEQYLRECKAHHVSTPPEVDIGTVLEVNDSYFDSAYETVYYVGVLLSQRLWRQLLPSETAKADEAVTEICLNLIEQARYGLAIQILQYFTTSGRFSTDVSRLVFTLNLAQAYKWQGEVASCEKVLAQLDWRVVVHK